MKLGARGGGRGEVEAWTARLEGVTFGGGGAARVMLYCASNVGLGHLHRLVRVGEALREEWAAVDLLLVTDTQNLTAEEIDPAMGIVRLPEYEFREGTFKNRPAGLALDKQQLRDLRANLILAAASGFQPHAILMDTNPHGKRNELEPLLRQLAKLKRPPLRVLQLRDLPFPPEEASRLKAEAGRVQKDLELYDEVLVAGDRGFFDLAQEYAWPEALAARLNYVGFVVPPAPRSAPEARQAAGSEGPAPAPRKPGPVATWEGEGGAVDRGEAQGPSVREVRAATPTRHIVAAMGGGWELETFGRRVVEAFIHLFPEGGHGTTLTLVTGPGVEREGVERLAAEVKGRPDLRVERYTREFDAMLRGCDLAILQAGSTPYQILETDIPMLIYGREYSTREQQVRAERLGGFPGVDTVRPEDMGVERLAERMRAALEARRTPRRTGFSYEGARRAAQVLARGLRGAGESGV